VGVSLGDKGEHSRVIRWPDVQGFIDISGDDNPVHTDQEFASKTPFKECIVHGMLVESLISAAIGNKWQGAILMQKHEITYRAPVKVGDKVMVSTTVTHLFPAQKPRALLRCECKVGDKIVIDGNVLILLPIQ
jgi:3-hydroxybutyryl-CoA dehydratase